MVKKGENDIRFDLAHLIRSVQRMQGNPDCFGKISGRCDQIKCCWRTYCLELSGIAGAQELLEQANGEVNNVKGTGKRLNANCEE